MLQNAYFIAKISADAAENERHFAENLPLAGSRLHPGRLASAGLAGPGGAGGPRSATGAANRVVAIFFKFGGIRTDFDENMSELHECFRCYLQIDCYFEKTEYYNTGTITPYSFFDRIPNFKPSSRFLSLRS